MSDVKIEASYFTLQPGRTHRTVQIRPDLHVDVDRRCRSSTLDVGRGRAVTDIQIPAAMVEAVARSRAERGCPGVWSEFSEEDRDELRAEATDDLAAALSVCDVREEWGTKHLDIEASEYREVWIGTEEAGRNRFAALDKVWGHHTRLQKRLSITTPAEQVDTEGAR